MVANERKTGRTIKTTWEIRTYDVWGNARDGYEVNDTYRAGEIELELDVIEYNPGTEHAFLSASPSDEQLREALGTTPRVKIETDGDDMTIYVNRERDGLPLGEIYCTSHESLSPIR